MAERRDLVVAMLPRIEATGTAAESRPSTFTSYDVVMYAVGGSGTTLPELEPWLERVPALAGTRTQVLDASVATIDHSRTHEAYGAYLAGDKAAELLRDYLRPKVSTLDRLRSPGIMDPGTRIWLHLAARELEEVPWELLAWNPSDGSRTLFFRGLPTRTGPLFALERPLRTLFVATPDAAQFCDAIASDSSSNEVIVATGAHQLERARDFEVVHIVANAWVGPTLESRLLLGKGEILASHLSRLLFGSRVGLLMLSAVPGAPDTYGPASHRAFTHFGGEAFQCSIVAPVGPLGSEEMRFWKSLHAELRTTGSVDRALQNARAGRATPVCFFLRHRTGRVFARRSGRGSFESAAPEIYAGESASTGSLAAQHIILQRTLARIAAVDAWPGANSERSHASEALAAVEEQVQQLEDYLGALTDEDEDEL